MRLFSTLLVLLTFSTSFGQTKSYSTVKIANWTLEQFPKHFLKKAAKVYTEKNRMTGQLTYYQELNEYGKPEGLTVTIQKDDYTSPASAYYVRNGVTVYRAEFFSRSTKAYEIVNRSLDDLNDGPQVKREFINQKIQETVTYFENGKNKSEKNLNLVKFNSNGSLDGAFTITYDYFERIGGEKGYSTGTAKDGELQNFTSVFNGASEGSIISCFIKDGFAYIKDFNRANSSDTILRIKKILRNVRVSTYTTNAQSETMMANFSNPAVFYLNEESQKLDPNKILDLMTEYQKDYDDYFVKFNFQNNLLQGNFKGVYLTRDLYTQYDGIAEGGKIKLINILLIERDEKGTSDVISYCEASSDGDSLTYIVKNANREITSQKKFKITKNILVTNQKANSPEVVSFFNKEDFYPFEVVSKMIQKEQSN
jgi:hypothetical protein